MNRIKNKFRILITIIVFLIFNCFNTYSNNETDVVINAYKSINKEQKELMYHSLKQSIEQEWITYLNNDFEREKRIDILKNSKYENNKLVSKNYNYYIGDVSTPSTIAAFVYCLDRECNMDGYYEFTDEETNEFLQNKILKLITNIINKEESVKQYIKSFINNISEMKKTISKTIIENNIYINIEYDTENKQEIPGMSVLYRGDLNFYIYVPYSQTDIIDYIIEEGILK